MKILMVSDAFYPKIDGVVTYLNNSIRYLVSKTNKIIVLCPEYDTPYKETRIKGVKIIRFPSFSFPTYKEAKFSIPELKLMDTVFREFHPDIVHIHTPSPLGIIAMIFAKRHHIPIVNTYHTSLPDTAIYISPRKLLKLEDLEKRLPISRELELKLEDFQKKIIRLFKTRKREPFSSKAAWSIVRLLYNPSDIIIAPSPNIMKELKKHKVKGKIIVLSNGIELDKFKKKRSYNKKIKFLHVGRLAHEKKIDVLIESLAKTVSVHPDAKLSIIGDGPIMPEIKQKAARIGVLKNIRFYGYVNRDKLPALYRQHDVFITASEYETQGLVIIEAMASGLPVIGVNVLAIPDVVHPGITGFLAKRGNSNEIAKFMCLMIENPGLAKTLGDNARKEAEKHDVNACMAQMENIYKDLTDAYRIRT
ncbi:MAG: glycosyltransferase [archaeon]